MSALARTALRLSTVSALNADPTIAAMVAGRVYDSRIIDLDSLEPVPVIVVQDEAGTGFSQNNGGPPFDATVDLVLEISLKATLPNEAYPTQADLLTPVTDAELEAALDLLEERAINAITVADTPESLLIRQAVTRRVPRMRSSRFVLDGTGDRLATRLLTLTAELKTSDDDDPLTVPPGVFGMLPNPLRSVCMSLSPETPEYETCQMIASRWNAATNIALDGVDALLTVKPPLYPPAGVAPSSDPSAPDVIAQTIDLGASDA